MPGIFFDVESQGDPMPLTAANIITLSRLGAVPVYLYVLFGMPTEHRFLALVVFGLAALTDFFDGYLARKLGSVTEFGKIADPLVDRVLIVTAIISLYVKAAGSIPMWALALAVGRDLVMLVGSAVMLANGKSLKIRMSGKVSTALILFALSLLTLDKLGSVSFRGAGLTTFYAGLVLSLLTGLFYLGWGTKILLSKQGSEGIPA